MARAFIWQRAGGNVNIKVLKDLLTALETAVNDDELTANLGVNKRFLIKWLEENYAGKGGLIFVLKEPGFAEVHKLRDELISHLRLLMEK